MTETAKRNIAIDSSQSASAKRRSGHSATAWLVDPTLLQPQDGSFVVQEVSDSPAAARRQLQEPEDAALTGGTRSLLRRTIGLNLALRQRGNLSRSTSTSKPPSISIAGGALRRGAEPSFV